MIRTAAFALMLAGVAASAEAQDMLIKGGPIYTGVDAAPTADAAPVATVSLCSCPGSRRCT